MMPRDRKSLEEHALQGTKPAYVLPDSDVPSSRPKYPKGISGEAKSTFKRLVRMLEQRRTVTQGDAEILRLYAYLFDRHSRALEHIATEGEIVATTVSGKNGEAYEVMKPNQWLKIAEVCETKMANLLTQLGLTPRTRTQVKATKDAKPKEAEFPSRETATASAPVSDSDLLAGIDESKVQ
jgi:P27 family predicted phage terminase small subunit